MILKSVYFCMALLFTSNALAARQVYLVENFSADYNDPTGEASVGKFLVPAVPVRIKEETRVQFHKRDQKIVIEYNNIEFDITDIPAEILNLKKAKWSNLNVNITKDHGHFHAHEMAMATANDSKAIRNINVECPGNFSNNFELEQLFYMNCTQNSHITIDSFKSSGSSRARDFFSRILENLPREDSRSTFDLTNLDLEINNNRYELSLKAKLDISIRLKSEGLMTYDKSKSLLTIRVDKAKAGFISIHSKLFKELKKEESDTFKVNKPYLYITL